MRLSIVVYLTASILRFFGLALLAPLAVALAYGERGDALGFALAAAVAAAAGHVLVLLSGRPGEDLRRVEGLAIVSGTWLVVALAGAIPYAWVGLGVVDAVFESMSGLTTTGATILDDFARYGRGIFFWRALTQWLGGMGVITLFVAVLPRLAIGGRQLFFAEAPGPTDEKLTPQIRKTAGLLWRLYAGLTAIEIVALRIAGMPFYDATVHGFTTLSAGGFSPHAQSIMGYASPAVEWIVIVFMFLAGANFAVQYRALRHPGVLARDTEFRAYGGIVAVGALLLVAFISRHGEPLLDTIRQGIFQTLTILTTTGYASADFQSWSNEAKAVLFLLMFIGGSAGSAAGGPKIVRLVLIARYVFAELKRTLHPHAILPVKLGGRVVSDEVMRAVLTFFLLYLTLFAGFFLVVMATARVDLVTGLTATIATLGNIGPGLNMVGPMESYAHLPSITKVTLTAAMWIGRLEVITVLAILRPEVWTTATWKSGPAASAAVAPIRK
jgi:trk system potassium uptake protein